MADLEITRLCAEAMGFTVDSPLAVDGSAYWIREKSYYPGHARIEYDPLHNDAQAMALVKRFGLSLNEQDHDTQEWTATWFDPDDPEYQQDETASPLNRAIVQCVAQMRRAKGDSPRPLTER